MNKTIIIADGDEELQHMGIRGMKGKSIPDDALQNLSKKVRTERYRIDKKIKRGEKFISKYEKANAKQIVNRYNKDPLKKEAVDNYIKSMKITSSTLGELRLQLMDAKM